VEQERETLGTSEIIYRLIMRSSVCNSYNYNQGAFERDHYSCKMQTKPNQAKDFTVFTCDLVLVPTL
jgi:hypothetical protein